MSWIDEKIIEHKSYLQKWRASTGSPSFRDDALRLISALKVARDALEELREMHTDAEGVMNVYGTVADTAINKMDELGK